jgi:16S rRNA (cytidine1402-2'-O)-methyltransferase
VDELSGDRRNYLVAGNSFPAPPLAAGLYVVATPIGNLRDITIRALETLAAADLVLCEDTRVSVKLLDNYGITTRRRSMHEHNERALVDSVLEQLMQGKSIALISDAGTPLVSDPGFPLVRAARERGLPVFAIPGASAMLAALSTAGLPSDSFSFFGFLPAKAEQRRKVIMSLAGRTETLILYESPRRLGATIAALAEVLGPERKVAVAMELTKRFERVRYGTLGALAAKFDGAAPKGEAVILVAGAPDVAPVVADWHSEMAQMLATEPVRTTVDALVEKYPQLKRKDVYDAALSLKADQ